MSNIPLTATTLNYKKRSRLLCITFNNGSEYELSSEYLRVYSPSAEVRGHAPGQEVLVTNKKHVEIQSIIPAGRYGIHIEFNDGHKTGIYAWDYLQSLGENKEKNWNEYQRRLKSANATRDTIIPIKIS